ncbi:Protein of unknown function [Ruminococcaceae bacterium KH2T8]|nr:Protein of unknown function [Ruminococcaceae bacterium KH2T8]
MKRLLSSILIVSLMICSMSACAKKNDSKDIGTGLINKADENIGRNTACDEDDYDPFDLIEEEQIQNICELVVMRSYYHTVTTATKTAGTGLSHAGEEDTEYWLEYTVYVDLGVDISAVSVRIEENTIIVTLPHSRILDGIHVVPDSIEDVVAPPNRWYRNDVEITAEDINEAINDTKDDIEEEVLMEDDLFDNADERVEALIRSYIDTLMQNSGTEYRVEFEYVGDRQSLGTVEVINDCDD